MSLFSHDEKTLSISPSSIVFTIAFILALAFLFYIRSILIIVFLAIILATALNPAVIKLEKKLKIPRIFGVLIVYTVLITLLLTAFALIVPPLLLQSAALLKIINIDGIQDKINNFSFTLAELSGLMSSFGSSFNTVFLVVSSTFNGVFTFTTVIVVSAYLLIDWRNLHKKIYWLSKKERHLEIAEEFVVSLEQQLGGWVRGQIILMILIGTLTFFVLSLLGVPFALPLAILAGLFEILPNLGPTLSAIPAIFIAFLSGGPILGTITLVYYIIVQQIENNFIVPRIMQKNADVNPLITIVSILVGLKLGGFVGALLAVPTYILLRTLYSFWYQETHS